MVSKKNTMGKVDKHSEHYYDFDRNVKTLRHFSSKEFDSPDEPGSGKKMCPLFLKKLDTCRENANVPFVITSGYRSKNHNKKVGGVLKSSHTETPCKAVDISANNSTLRYKILSSLIKNGFNRIGIGSNFIHVDASDKPPNVAWHYY